LKQNRHPSLLPEDGEKTSLRNVTLGGGGANTLMEWHYTGAFP